MDSLAIWKSHHFIKIRFDFLTILSVYKKFIENKRIKVIKTWLKSQFI